MALLKEDLEALRRVPLFVGMDAARLRLIAFTSPRLCYEPGDILFRQDEDGNAAFVILKGVVEVVVERNGIELPIATLRENEIVGDISVICGEPHIATARAQTRIEVLKIKQNQFCELARSSPEANLAVMQHLAHKLARTVENIATLKSEGAQDASFADKAH